MSATSVPPTGAVFAMTTRMLAASLIGALFFIAVALVFVLGDSLDEAPPLVVPVAQAAAGVAVHMLVEAIAYRPAPLSPSLTDEQARSEAQQRWQQGMFVRFALSELVAIVSVAAAFVVTEGGFAVYVGGMLVSLVLMWLHVWPGRRSVDKVADALEREGRPSGLREVFGVA